MERNTRVRQATRVSSPTCPPQLQRRRLQGRNETYRGLTPYEFADSRKNKKAQRFNGNRYSQKVTKLTKNNLEVLSLITFHLPPSPSAFICVHLRLSCLTFAPLRLCARFSDRFRRGPIGP